MTNQFIKQQVILAVILIIGIIVIGLALSVAQNTDFLTKASDNKIEQEFQKAREQVLKDIKAYRQEIEELQQRLSHADENHLNYEDQLRLVQRINELLPILKKLIKLLETIDQTRQALQQQPNLSQELEQYYLKRLCSLIQKFKNRPTLKNYLTPIRSQVDSLIKKSNSLPTESLLDPEKQLWQQAVHNLKRLQEKLKECSQKSTLAVQQQCLQELRNRWDEDQELLNSFIRLRKQHQEQPDPYVQLAEEYRRLPAVIDWFLLSDNNNTNSNPPASSQLSPAEKQKRTQAAQAYVRELLEKRAWLYIILDDIVGMSFDRLTLDQMIDQLKKTAPKDNNLNLSWQELVSRYEEIKAVLEKIVSCQDYECVRQRYHLLESVLDSIITQSIIIMGVSKLEYPVEWVDATRIHFQDILNKLDSELTGKEFPQDYYSSPAIPSINQLSDNQAKIIQKLADDFLKFWGWAAIQDIRIDEDDGREYIGYVYVTLDEVISFSDNPAIINQYKTIKNILIEITECKDSRCVLQAYKRFVGFMNRLITIIQQNYRYPDGTLRPEMAQIIVTLKRIRDEFENNIKNRQ